MLKFSSILSFVAVIATILLFTSSFISAAGRPPRGHALTKDYTYEMFVRHFHRHERTAEEHAFRRPLFEQRRDHAIAHNNKLGKSWTLGVNEYSDYTQEELDRMKNKNYWAVKKSYQPKHKPSRIHVAAENEQFAHQIDWVKAGMTTAVKSQSQCGSCWVFAAVETMESWYAIATGQLNDLSVQEVVSCAPNPRECGGTGGCNGGTSEIAYDYVMENGGITEEWQYSYASGREGISYDCKKNDKKNHYNMFASFSGYVQVARNDAMATMSALQQGPLAIVVSAGMDFVWYDGGVFAGCNYTQLDHGVQLVGYGFDQGLNKHYWTVRNSWNPTWGEQGYIRIHNPSGAGEEQPCIWDKTPGSGIACKGDTTPEYICGECGLLYDVSYPLAAPLS